MAFKMSRLLLTVLSFFALFGADTRGQTVAEGAITSIPDLLALDGREAEANPRPVRLTAIVLGESTMFPFVSLHDGTRGVGVRLKPGHPPLKPGDLVLVKGRTTNIKVSGNNHPRVTADEIEVTGADEVPQGKAIAATEIKNAANYDQWVTIEGYIMEWKYRAPDLLVRISTPDGFADANVTVPAAADLPPLLVGAKVRVTGAVVSTPALGVVMFVPELKQMQVLAAGVKEVFDAPLVTIGDVMARKLEPGRRWRVHGVVAARFDEQHIVIRGQGGAMYCQLTSMRVADEADTTYADGGRWASLNDGDEVELVGSIAASGDVETRSSGLMWCHARVTGKAESPKPKSVAFNEILEWRNHDEWVSVEGVVVGWMQINGMTCYAVLGTGGYAQFYVRGTDANPFPADLHGARLRFTGVTRTLLSNNNELLVCPSPSHVEIIKAGTSDPFELPLTAASDIASGKLPQADRVKMRGVLVGRPSDAVICVRGNDRALRAGLQSRWNRNPANIGALYADCGAWPEMKIGDEVEVIGSSMRGADGTPLGGVDLWSAQVRVLKSGGVIKPVSTTLPEVMAGARVSDFVEVRGRLLSLHQLPMPDGQWRTSMLLEDGDARVPASFLGTGRVSFSTLKLDDEIAVRGVVDRVASTDPVQILIGSAGDVRSHGLSPVVWRRQFWLSGVITVVIIGLLLAWIGALRRSGRVQTEVAQMLEQKVNDRTIELRKAKIELTRALDQERELSELKSRFVTMVSHEFRTPLGIIMSAIELIRHYDDRLPVEQRHELQQDIFSSTRHMAGLMEQVLVLGRVEAGKLGCKNMPVDLDGLAEKITDECLSATNRKCPVVWRSENDLSGARADEALLRHIFSNLISNAVKYSLEGSEVLFTARREGDAAVFQVIDKGIGIPESDRQHLFEAFQRGSNVGEIPGTGLGLVIVKRCVDLHGGSCEIESEPGKGTTFIVRLPLFANDE